MNPFIQNIGIQNFKSIKHCRIGGCKRINLFIGPPNTGKSNLIEALSVFSLPFLKENTSKNINQLIRLERGTELFHNGNYAEPAIMETNKDSASIMYHKNEGISVNITTGTHSSLYLIDEKLNVRSRGEGWNTPFKMYSFQKQHPAIRKFHSRYLIPPFGRNLFSIIEREKQLHDEISALLAEYDLKLVLDKSVRQLKIMRYRDKNEIFLLPFNSLSESLQRLIFYKTVIASNENSILLFDDPGTGIHPAFLSAITQEMIHNKSNQYFLTTHSQYIIDDFTENSLNELAVYEVRYENENHETKLRQLSAEELQCIY